MTRLWVRRGLTFLAAAALATVVWVVTNSQLDEEGDIHQHRQRNEVAHDCLLRFAVESQAWQQDVVVAFSRYVQFGEPVMIPDPPQERCPEFIDPSTGLPLPHE